MSERLSEPAFVTRDELKMHLQPIYDDVHAIRKALEGRSWLGARGRRVIDQFLPMLLVALVAGAISAGIAVLVKPAGHVVVQHTSVVRPSP